MIVYKALGAIGIIFSGFWFYVVCEGFQKKKSSQLDGFIELLAYIRNQIKCYMMPIDSIFKGCSKSILLKCGYFSNSIPKNLEELLSNSVLYIDNESELHLNNLARGFGTVYFNEQIKLCDDCLNELNKIREKNTVKRKNDRKVSLAICISMSLSLILILI